MNRRMIRAIDLEFALIVEIRKEGSQRLLNALENCGIRVETCNGYVYAVMAFPSQYDSQTEWELCNEVEKIGLPLGIFPCDSKKEVES